MYLDLQCRNFNTGKYFAFPVNEKGVNYKAEALSLLLRRTQIE